MDLATNTAVKVAAYGAYDIEVANGYVYFAMPQKSVVAPTDTGVGRVAEQGGAVDWYLVNGSGGRGDGVAVDTEWVYWISGFADVAAGIDAGVYRAPHDGFGSLSPGGVLQGAKREMLVATSNVYGHLVLSGAYLYWIEFGGLARVKKDGGEVEHILSKEQWSCCFRYPPAEFVVSGEYIYWVTAETETGGLGRIRVDGTEMQPLYTDFTRGLPSELIANETQSSAAVAVDAKHVYWSHGENDRVVPNKGRVEVLRMPIGGGEPEFIVGGQNDVRTILVTDDHVYWISSLDQKLVRVSLQELE